MKKYNILVTGGCGFIGWNFIRRLYENQDKIQFNKIINVDKLDYSAINTRKESYYDDRYTFIECDIRHTNEEIFRQYNIDVVVNFAAQTHVDNSINSSASFIDTNIVGMHILMDEAMKYWNKKKMDGRFIQVSCYDENTRALTKEGFKYYNELNVGDIVLTINAETGIVEEKPIEKIIIQDYDGDMIHFSTKLSDMMVTPNHRMYFQRKNKNILSSKIEIDEAQNIIGQHNLYYPKGIWKGKRDEKIHIDGLGYVPIKELFYLCGMFIGDGFTAKQIRKTICKSGLCKKEMLEYRNNKGQFIKHDKTGSREFSTSISWRIYLDIPKLDKGRKRLEETLTALNIAYTTPNNKSGEHVYITSEALVKFFEQFGKGFKNKNIPVWMLQYDSEILKYLYDGLIDSDGHYTPSSELYTTSSPKLMSDFCELSIKLGYSPRVSIRKPVEGGVFYKKESRYIQSRTDGYTIHIRKENKGIGQRFPKMVPYTGKVWCVKVKDNKNLIVERGGICQYSGNTDEVYGSVEDNSGRPFDENTPYHPNNPYSASKAAAELLLKSYIHTYNFPGIITNCSNNYGPGQHEEKFIPKIIKCYESTTKVPIYGDGLQSRDWIYVDDHCDGIIDTILRGKIGEHYLFGTNKTIYNIKLVHHVLNECYKLRPAFFETEHITDRLGHDRTYCIDYSKAEKCLGWMPKTDLKTGLEKTINWYVNNT